MKKQLIFGSFIALSGVLNAQATWNGSGTTGNAYRSGNIGVNNTSPSYAIDATSSTYDNGIRVKNGMSISNVGVHLDNTTAGGNRWALMSMGNSDPWGGPGNFALYNYGSPGGSLPSLFISGGLGTNPANGNVGIGTISPTRKLTVNGDVSLVSTSNGNLFEILGNGQTPAARGISLDNNPNGNFNFFIHNWQSANGLPEFRFREGFGGASLMKIDGDGRVTINNFYANGNDDAFVVNDGTANKKNFTVTKNGNVNIKVPNSTYISGGSQVALGVYQNNQTTGGFIGQVVETDYNTPGFQNTVLLVNRDDTKAFSVNKKGTGIVENFVIMGNGQTYIGPKKATGNHSNALLSVNGKILAQSIYVNTDPNVWADYVFEKNYKLMNLEEVEKFYLQNKHLPGVPSAKEVQENGDNLVETDAVLLKKIEELTLYIVELKKEVNELKSKNK